MSEADLVLFAGAFLGFAAAFLGGVLLYRNRLRTHLALRERIEEERSALYEEISEIDQEELAETEAGKTLIRFSQASIQQFGYPQEDPMISLKKHNLDLLRQLDRFKKRSAQSEEHDVAMTSFLQDSRQIVADLKKENERLRLAQRFKEQDNSTHSAQIEQNLRLTLEEVARLQNLLADANMRLIDVEAKEISPFSGEIHQILSSNLQNIDLLLGESLGPLNALQRNLLEAIKAPASRLHNVLGDFVQWTNLKAGSLQPQSVELRAVVQDAVEEISSQIRAKRITLQMDLAENIPLIYADREVLRQILTRLLSNAAAASPLQGVVHLRANIKDENGEDHLLVQVSDMGGGIAAEDLPRVFTPVYREADAHVRGTGELGMQLFIARTLTEAVNGKIWVDTELDVGSTFNVLFSMAREWPVPVSTEK